MARAKENHKFALCVEKKDCEDLEKCKIYQLLPDDDPERVKPLFDTFFTDHYFSELVL